MNIGQNARADGMLLTSKKFDEAQSTLLLFSCRILRYIRYTRFLTFTSYTVYCTCTVHGPSVLAVLA